MLKALAIASNRKTDENDSLLTAAKAGIHKREYLEANLPIRTLQLAPKTKLKISSPIETTLITFPIRRFS